MRSIRESGLRPRTWAGIVAKLQVALRRRVNARIAHFEYQGVLAE